MLEDWTAQLRAEARGEVARIREAKGLPPWDWKDGTQKSAVGVMESLNMAMPDVVCVCGCGEWFTPWKAGMRYKRGHKPATAKKRAAPRPMTIPKPTSAGTVADAANSYVVARANMDRELKLLESQIDLADEEIEKFRLGIEKLYSDKDRYAQRHELITASREALGALCEPLKEAIA